MGRATNPAYYKIYVRGISIHALRGEGDAPIFINTSNKFNISIHALRGEGDYNEPSSHYIVNPISIHALRGEGDIPIATFRNDDSNFNPRPPWGGRLPKYTSFCILSIFQSTPSVGRATPAVDVQKIKHGISIHALRGEGDKRRAMPVAWTLYFNPRPPWGGRRYATRQVKSLLIFQSTPSVGRATAILSTTRCSQKYFNPRPPWGGRLCSTLCKGYRQLISIHALRGEGD